MKKTRPLSRLESHGKWKRLYVFKGYVNKRKKKKKKEKASPIHALTSPRTTYREGRLGGPLPLYKLIRVLTIFKIGSRIYRLKAKGSQSHQEDQNIVYANIRHSNKECLN